MLMKKAVFALLTVLNFISSALKLHSLLFLLVGTLLSAYAIIQKIFERSVEQTALPVVCCTEALIPATLRVKSITEVASFIPLYLCGVRRSSNDSTGRNCDAKASKMYTSVIRFLSCSIASVQRGQAQLNKVLHYCFMISYQLLRPTLYSVTQVTKGASLLPRIFAYAALFIAFFPRLSSSQLVLQTLLSQLDDTSHCGKVIALPNLHRLINHSLLERNPQLQLLTKLISLYPSFNQALFPPNFSIRENPPFFTNGSQLPLYALELRCDPKKAWIPTLVYNTTVPSSFLVVRLQPFDDLNACTLSQCNSSKCTWTVHGGTKIRARTCCSNDTSLCRDVSEQGRGILVVFNAACAVVCLILIPCVFNQRRRHHEARGWALMELFLLGAATLYSILLLDWLNPSSPTCCLAVWLRQIGFSTFYGSIVLKIYRNLQEYRVRKAHHVFVKEEDLLKYLVYMLALTITGLTAWTLGSWSDVALWTESWPQCSNQPWSLTWHGYELIFLLYGMRLCYKARNSSWLERWQFTVAVCLEAVITLMANLIRYSIRNSGHSDTLMTVTFVQLHLTVSVNIVIVIAPKFYLVSSDNNRRTQTLSGSSARAHPSLAKLRDNLLNGTIDFAEVPIVDMNPDDIRAELKRVYTQLRMYKLKNIYQDNPHISKRKGGKKSSDKASKNRRISIPPSSSPKVRRVEEEERSDLTVESAPHNVFLSTYKLQLEPHQSVRV